LFSSRSALLLTTLGMVVGTCLVQWAVALGAFIALNRWLVRRSKASSEAPALPVP